MTLRRLRAATLAFVFAQLLAACGDGRETTPNAAATAAPASPATAADTLRHALQAAARTAPRLPARARPLASPAAASDSVDPVDPVEAAQQLLDFAEQAYPALFVGRPATASHQGYLFRFYPATGVYLAVRDGVVYTLGGPFGNSITTIGPLAQFITPVHRQAVQPCSPTGTAWGTYSTPRARVGQNVAVAVAGCTTAITRPLWRQTGGPAVALLSDRSQVLSFEPAEAGVYTFELSFVDDRRNAFTTTVAVPVGTPAQPVRLSLRASQAVRMGGKMSVRAWPALPAGETVASIRWEQLDGPSVTLDTTDDHVALFTTPDVARDTMLRLRATVTGSLGTTGSDEVAVLVEQHAQAGASPGLLWSDFHVPRVYAYRADSPYANHIAACVLDASQVVAGTRFNLCTLQVLPFLAQEATDGGLPSIDQVMKRVVVSHDWLGRNFEAFLRTHDSRGDFRRMLRSVTAIVLSTQVRPSFYFGPTGAIYLDADTFWLTPEERDTVNESPDYRGAYSEGLAYDSLWRYVKDGRNAFPYADPRARVTRTLDDIHLEAAFLLYHELAHALDYLPPLHYGTLIRSRSAWENLSPRYANMSMPSDEMSTRFALGSVLLAELGQVRFKGETATPQHKALTPLQVADAFRVDLATDDYAYATTFEDAAMTLEEFLMFHRLGVRRDFAFIDPMPADARASTIAVRWGQRGRIGEPALNPRLRLIVQHLTPWVDLAETTQLPAPAALRAGESWGANLDSAGSPRRQGLATAASVADEQRQFRQDWRRMQAHRGGHRPGAGVDVGMGAGKAAATGGAHAPAAGFTCGARAPGSASIRPCIH